MQCVILAGGLGTRMKAHTQSRPKALIEAGGRPFLHHQLEAVAERGVTDVVLSIGYRGEMIRDSAGDGSAFGLRVRYVEDGPVLLGTGGALRKAYDEGALAERFLLLYGDSYLPVPFRPVYDALDDLGCDAVMTVYRNDDQLDRSNVWFADGRLRVYDKKPTPEIAAEMRFVDYGLSAVKRNLISDKIQSGAVCDLADVLTAASREGRLKGFEVSDRFYEIGSPQGLADFKELIRNEKNTVQPKPA